MSILLFLLYPIAIQYERGGWWVLVIPLTLLALVIDVFANYTELAVLTWDFPRKGEYTFSTRCQRLQYYDTWGGQVARVVKSYTNFFDPQNNHII